MEFLKTKDKFDEEEGKTSMAKEIRTKEDFELYYEKDLGVI